MRAGRPRSQVISPSDFAAAMAALGPFEARPRLAVAVSGGPDSMALALLARDWALAHGGYVTALTVDHGLRSESAAEAARVGEWLAARQIDHHILAWIGAKPAADIQAAARAARYRLLGRWCADNGVLHLLLAQHQDDQAETLLLRLGRGSGVDGLAAMAPVTETADVRLLRPLLSVPREHLIATLRAAGQDWIDDPSNDKIVFSRVRLRRLMPDLAAEGLTPGRLAATARRLSRARTALEAMTARAAARHVRLHDTGWAACAPGLLDENDEIALRLLARLAMVVSGGDYPPRLERLERLLAALRQAGRPRTLAGCRVVPGGDGFRFFREPAAMAPPLPVSGPQEVCWDGRFRLKLAGDGQGVVGALGQDGWRAVADHVPPNWARMIPPAARPSLPALSDTGGILAVPHLGYKRGAYCVEWVEPAPARPLTAVGHCLV